VCSLNFGLGETSFRDAVDVVGLKGGTEAKRIHAKARCGTAELTKAERAFVSRKYEKLTRPCPFAEVTLEVPIVFGDHLDRFSVKCALDAPEDLGAVLKDQQAEVRHHRLLCFDRPCPSGACLASCRLVGLGVGAFRFWSVVLGFVWRGRFLVLFGEGGSWFCLAREVLRLAKSNMRLDT
jgi:hypothetical protein